MLPSKHTMTPLLSPLSLIIIVRYAPFIYECWRNPQTLAIISQIAGVELVPEMDWEIAHINISVKSEKQKAEELEALMDRSMYEADEGVAGCPWEDDKPIVDWHTDAYPFVCVTMLSDCTNMIGGETALRTGDGEIVKVRGPGMVHLPLESETAVSNLLSRAAQSSCKGVTSSIRLYVLSDQQSVLHQ